jgi:uncharacterized protein YfeS
VKSIFIALVLCSNLFATTISVVPIHEPLSLHGTDVDDIISETGEALQATVMSRPVALTGAFPEVLVEAIRSSHLIPSNNPNYEVDEANLLILCNVSIKAETTADELKVSIDVSQLKIPREVDITSRQLLKLTLVAMQRTLEAYNKPQTEALIVTVTIDGTTEKNQTLKNLELTFMVDYAH